MQEFSFDIEHVPGKENHLPDFLSRNPSEEPVLESDDADLDRIALTSNHSNHTDWKAAYEKPVINPLITQHETIAQQQQNDAIYRAMIRRWLDAHRNGPQNEDQARFLQIHSVAGHPDADETVRAILRNYYWLGVNHDVRQYVRECPICATTKALLPQPATPQRPHIPTRPWEIISIDVLGPYQATAKGNRFAIIAVDCFSNWVECRAYPEAPASNIIDFIDSNILARWGSPSTSISDNGPVFICERYTEYLEQKHIHPAYSLIFHQRANPVERRVQEFKKILGRTCATAASGAGIHISTKPFLRCARAETPLKG